MFFTRCLMFFFCPLESTEKTCRKLCQNNVGGGGFRHTDFLTNRDNACANRMPLSWRFVDVSANKNEGGTCARLRRPPSQ